MAPSSERNPGMGPLRLLTERSTYQRVSTATASAVVYRVLLDEPKSVAKMHEESLTMGIKEDAIDADDDAEQGKERVTDPELVRSIALLLGAVDLCVYPMILEGCSSRSVGRYSGYYYTVSMAAQVVTPILSGLVIDVAEAQLFLYTVMGAAMCVFIALAKHGDSILADEILRREAGTAE